MHPNITTIALASVAMIFFTMGGLYFFLIFPQKRLERWAKKRRFVLLTSDIESYSDNPLLEGTGRGQHLFKVKVRMRDGRVRSGFVRLGSARVGQFGVFSDYSEEFWDDTKSP